MKYSPDVLIVGAGPTGLALALQALAFGARVQVIERRARGPRPSRALIVHPRTLEQLRPLGITDLLLARANRAPEVQVHVRRRVVNVRLADLALPETAFPHLTLVRQADIEAVLARTLAERGVEVEWETDLKTFQEIAGGVRATVNTSQRLAQLEAAFIVGCDGPTSSVRQAAGIAWCGGAYAEEVLLADVELDPALAPSSAHVGVSHAGLVLIIPLGERATWRLLTTFPAGDRSVAGSDAAACRAAIEASITQAALPTRLRSVAWSARVPLQHRLAARFRRGRVFLAGDAAHTHSPALGQGMNTGIQDALNLGWKLGLAGHASDVEVLLDSYEHERRAIARHMVALTDLAFWAEAGRGLVPSLLRGVVAPLGVPVAPALLNCRPLVAHMVREVSQLRLSYRASPISGQGQPTLAKPRPGQWLPDTEVVLDGRLGRLHAQLARPGIHVLLQRDVPAAACLGLEEPVVVHRLTRTPGTAIVAVRPDGYIGFTGGQFDEAQLRAWLKRIGCGAAGS